MKRWAVSGGKRWRAWDQAMVSKFAAAAFATAAMALSSVLCGTFAMSRDRAKRPVLR